MINWEYKVVDVTASGRVIGEGEKDIETFLNDLGSKGWEAYAVINFPLGNNLRIQHFLKREVERKVEREGLIR